MLKISALNEDSSSEEDDNEGEEEVTREALEEIAMQQYGKTLELQKKGRHQDALNLLKDLLDTELLYDVKKVEGQESTTSPLLKLKYLCYKNIASISAQLGDKESSVEAYLEASRLDNTDITLWYRLGKISLELRKYDLALFAFERGIECNPKHWPCLDHLVTLLLGLGQYNECISTIYNALQLDEDYLRGRAYRKYIFTDYPHVQQYMSMLNPLYKWTPEMDAEIEGDDCTKLIKEATDINETFIQQVAETNVCKRLPVLTLNKPIENLTWLSVGESIVDMHMHISEKLLSHACIVKVNQPEEKLLNNETVVEAMEVDVSITKQNGEQVESKQNGVEVKNGDNGNESDKMDVDQDVTQIQETSKIINDSKKASRRRGSSVRFLQQWEWCNKRKSSRKKPNKTEQETLYHILKRLLPKHLRSEENGQERQENNKVGKEFKGDDSMDTMDLYKLFEEKERNAAESNSQGENKDETDTTYFNTEKEQTEVQAFVQKYVDSTCDIITMVDDFVLTLSKFWDIPWPEGLGDVYMEANWCSRQHSDPPLGYMNEENVLKNFIKINLLHLEVAINKLLLEEEDGNKNVEMELIDLLRMLCSRSEELGDEAITLTLRFLWVKCHSLLYKNEVEFALDCLYYIIDKLFDLDDEGNAFTLKVVNFTKCPTITKNICLELIKSLERNKLLSTVPGLFDHGKYEEVISILQDSFKYCQSLASKQDWKAMSLDWAVQLMTLIESLWAANDTEQCFISATVCLREALKQYTLCEQSSDELEKWSLVVIKTLVCIEHILSSEGSVFLDVLPEKNTIHMIQDVIQIIVHQLDDNNTNAEMPLNTVTCWIILHYVFQREEDCNRMPKKDIPSETNDPELPVSFMVLFMAHEQLGRKGWCANNDSKLLFFILKTVISRLRSPALTGVVEIVSQYLEQCVLCLFGHPKKIKQRYLVDHNVMPGKLDWEFSQLIFDLYRPDELPEWNFHRMASITGETEQLFQNMLSLAPPGLDPHSHYSDVISFIEGKKSKLHHFNVELPYKMRDIYYLLADYYFKNNETIKALKYYAYDIIICRKRFDSWAGMALARGSLLETKLNSCESFRNEMEYLNRATAVEFCYKQALEIDTSHSMLWIEYGNFVYGVHSFCSRMLKQASESLSMENFEVLENRKESMLDTASKCFVKALKQWMEECEGDDKGPQDERWLHYYMLGKISEKKNEQPQKYLDYYQKAATFLQENNATYPSKINYSNPQNLSVEALEIQYRIHASILKYIEQHENKVICSKDGKCFKACLDKCATGPFSRKKAVKEVPENKEQNDNNEKVSDVNGADSNANQDAGIKRSNSELTEEAGVSEPKKVKIEEEKPKENTDGDNKEKKMDPVVLDKPEAETEVQANEEPTKPIEEPSTKVDEVKMDTTSDKDVQIPVTEPPSEVPKEPVKENVEETSVAKKEDVVSTQTDQAKVAKEAENTSNTGTSKDNSTSESSSDSSSSDSTSSSSSSSSSDSNGKRATPTEMTQEEISQVISTCLNSLEDCVSRFPLHYKALYRLTHFHFYYKKEKNIQRCKEIMLGNFVTNTGAKLQGLFCERKNSNFFNSIWRIPSNDVDRPGSFATHMSRCILITMEILKELDDHQTLLDLSLHLQKSPEADKKYLRESERIELFQQALSLCTRSIKGQLNKFNKVDDLSSTTPEKQQVSNFMLDLYAIYRKIEKNLPTKIQMFSGLLIDCYKIYSGKLDSENLLPKCIKKCQSILVAKRQQAQLAAQPPPPPPVSKVETPTTTAPPITSQPSSIATSVAPTLPPPPKKSKPSVSIIPATSFLPHVDSPMPYPKVPNPYLPYLPMMERNLLSALSSYDQTAAALYLSNMSYSGLSPAFQQDLFRQIISSTLDTSYSMQTAKPKYNQSSSNSKPKTSSASTSKPVPNVTKVATSQAQTSKQNVPKSTTPNIKSSSSSSYVSTSQKPHSADVPKTGHAQMPHSGSAQSVHTNIGSNVQQSHQPSTSANSNVKPAYQSSVNSGSNVKQSHQSSSDRSNSGSKSVHQSSPVTSGNDKPAHQSSSTSSNVKPSSSSPSISVKPAHQLLSNAANSAKPTQQSSSSTSISAKPAHQSLSSTSSSAKPTHQSSSNTSSSVKQPSSSPSISVKSAHQLTSSPGIGAKSAYQSSSTSSSAKPAHQSSSNMSSSVKPSSSSPSISVKSAHQLSSSPGISSKSVHQSSSGSAKPTHQSSSKTHQSSSSSAKPAHQSSSSTSNSAKPTHQSSSSTSNSAKPTHQLSSSTSGSAKSHQSSSNRNSSAKTSHHQSFSSSNTSVHSMSPGPPHQQVSPGKTLQEKLAERQKQNPSVSKSSSDHSSGRTTSMQQAALAKLPSSLSITKTGSSSKPSSTPHSTHRSSDSKKDNRNVSQQSGGHNEKLAQPRKVIDSSEIIVLDDDD